MLIGHRYERTPHGDLRIHSYNRVQAGLVLLTAALALAAPTAFVVGGLVEGRSPLASLGPLSWLLAVTAFLLLVVLAVGLLVYAETGETLTLSRGEGVGRRHTRTLFGRRERLQVAFALDGLSELQLRRQGTMHRATTQLWLVRNDGTETRLTPGNVAVHPGTTRTDRWLEALAGYLQLPVPVGVLDAPRTPFLAPAARGAPASPRRATPSAARAAAVTTRQRRTAAPQHTAAPLPVEKAGAGIRIFFGLLGTLLGLLELKHLLTLLAALSNARIRVGGYRFSAHTYYWSEQPVAYAFNVLFGLAMVVLVGMFAVGCLRLALFGRIRSAS